MKTLSGIFAPAIVFSVLITSPVVTAQAADWTIAGAVLTPGGLIADGAVSVSGQTIAAVGPGASLPAGTSAVKVPGVILPGFIDLHNHLPWNVVPRWLPGRKFNNRYEWQDTAEYDRLLVTPHNATRDTAACESEIYAEIKALVGGSTSVVGSFLPDPGHPKIDECALGLTRNLDLASELPFTPPDSTDPCVKAAGAPQTLLGVVDNEVFPMELTHTRMDFLLCVLRSGKLRSLIIHLSEGGNTDSSAHREFTMLSRAKLLTPGLVIIHGTALRNQDFAEMAANGVGLIWSPRSNDELYGSTTNIAAARQASVPIALAPDWSPSGSGGMLQEIGYAGRRYGVGSDQLIAMATSVPAKLARLDDHIGALAPNKLADLVVINNTTTDPKGLKPLDLAVRASPADVVLVVVGGQPLYGDPAVLAQLLPPGSKTEQITVCGAQKALYLGQSAAAVRKQSLTDIQTVLNASLAKAGSSLAAIECD